ncbi:hypothetical protein MRX96_015693 [Rhipicephalus microplus]
MSPSRPSKVRGQTEFRNCAVLSHPPVLPVRGVKISTRPVQIAASESSGGVVNVSFYQVGPDGEEGSVVNVSFYQVGQMVKKASRPGLECINDAAA